MLLHLNWKPLFWNEWHDSHGNRYKLVDTKKAAIAVAPALVDSYIAISLQRADAHYEGQGIAHGVDWNTSLVYHRHLKNKSSAYSAQCALECILCAGTWPEARIAATKSEHNAICKRCGKANDDALH